MIRTGLVSVTFRKLSPREIINLVKKSGLHGIEWGGDIHVPHGDIEKAREVYTMTTDSGIFVASYGSYYKAGCKGKESLPFEQVLDTALALHAPCIRVWAGNRSSFESDRQWFEKVADDSRRIADIAQKAGIGISFEYHSGTLTDTVVSTLNLLETISHPNVHTYWQPPVGADPAQNITDLERMANQVTNVHVFHWNGFDKVPLENGRENWQKYIEVIKRKETDRYCLIEFVKDDSIGQFLEDADSLKDFLLF